MASLAPPQDRSAKEEGIFVGPSSGAALAAVAKRLPDIPNGSKALTFCYDTGERYLSVEGLFQTRSCRTTSTRVPAAASTDQRSAWTFAP